jgi:predicted RND superfamily exporter protein
VITGVKRYATWIDRHAILVLLVSVIVAVLGGMLAARLPLQSDLTSLLPSSQSSVRELKAISKRARPFGTVQIAIESKDAARTAAASDALAKAIDTTVDPALMAQFSRDDGPRDRYAWKNRFLFADYQDLVDARQSLEDRIKNAKLEANPLFISLDDEKPDADRLEELEKKLTDLEERATHPPARASKDGHLRVFVIQTTFSASDTGHAHALVTGLKKSIAATRADFEDVSFDMTGNVIMGMHEHDSVLDGMTMSLALTVLLCGLALVAYYRSGRVVLAMLLALGVGVSATFAIAWATVGHLNVMTAFLFAIVVGNGINASLIFVARYLEDLRADADHRSALATSIKGALPGTLGAAATAAVAYGSLLITDFRGFREFGAIAGIGMVVTWITTFTTLPALLSVLSRRGLRPKSPPKLGDWLARALPQRRVAPALVFAGLLTTVAIAISAVYIKRDPFTHDWRDLQSSTPAINRAHRLNAHIKEGLGGRSDLAGQAYQLVIAVGHRDDVGPIVASLRAANEKVPAEKRWMNDVFSMEDMLPSRQDEKLAILAEIRSLIDNPDLQASLSDEDKARLAKVRPPDGLRPVRDDEVPAELAWPFIERDGSRGRLIIVRGAARLNSFDVDDRLEFAARARELKLPPDALLASESLVVADIIDVMEQDAPRMILFALLGSILAVVLFVGRHRHGMITIASGFAGVLVMVAACAVAGLRVHFLDLIALPITIGIGIDYAVNVAARDRQEGDRGIGHVLKTTGGAVLLCSFTTAVGYGTLLLSANGGIRAFGLAALIGELACVTVALIAAPAALERWRRRNQEGPRDIPPAAEVLKD